MAGCDSGAGQSGAPARKLVYWAYLALAGPLLGDPGPALGLSRVALPATPSFQQDGSPGSPLRFLWRNSEVLASFVPGGAVSIRSHEEANLEITLTGANSRSRPQGEGRSARKTAYYIGSSNRWHFDAFATVVDPAGATLVFSSY